MSWLFKVLFVSGKGNSFRLLIPFPLLFLSPPSPEVEMLAPQTTLHTLSTKQYKS